MAASASSATNDPRPAPASAGEGSSVARPSEATARATEAPARTAEATVLPIIAPASARKPAGIDHLLVEAGGRRWAFATTHVLEVVPSSRPTRLPGAPAHVLGLVNLRGAVVTVVDLAVRIAAEGALAAGTHAASDIREDGVIVVTRVGARRLGLAVDDVDDVRSMLPDERRDFPGQGAATASCVVRAAATVRQEGEDVVVGVIDVEALVRETLGLDLDTQREQQS